MNITRAEELTAAYLSGNISTDETDELMAWVNASPKGRKFFDNAVELWSITSHSEYQYPAFSKNKNTAWEQLENRLSDNDTRAHQPRSHIRPLWSSRWMATAAAVAVLLIAAWWVFSPNEVSVYATQLGERQEIILADGSQVWLNENTTLSYEFRDDQRYLELKGEAYFDVATDSLRPFQVHAGNALTTVLGTAFNMRAYPDEEQVEVSVSEGRVALEQVEVKRTPIAGAKVELAAGEVGVFDKVSARVKATKEESKNVIAWKERSLNFEGVPLSEVAAVLERYYHVEIELSSPGLGRCLFFGEYNDSPQVDYILALLEASLELDVQHSEGIYRLSGEACE